MSINKRLNIQTYGEYNTHGKNRDCIKLSIKNIIIFFSHDDIIAFNHPNTGLIVRENTKGNVIEKHFKWIDGGKKKAKENRINEKVFFKEFDKICSLEGFIN